MTPEERTLLDQAYIAWVGAAKTVLDAAKTSRARGALLFMHGQLCLCGVFGIDAASLTNKPANDNRRGT